MKILLVCFLLFFVHVKSIGQQTFIKTIDAPHGGRNVRVFQTSGQGIAVFSLDSLQLYQFNSCGNPEWAKQYDIPMATYPGDIIQTQNGGFALLNRIPKGNYYSTSVTLLSASGTVIWSKSYEDLDFNHFPYTISQDHDGNFIVLGNTVHVNNQPHYSFLLKLDGNGNHLWTRFFNFGPIWGGAIVTSDNGVLARIGNTLIKFSNGGNITWATWALTTNHHLEPIEVSDGYIFTGFKDGSNQISFHKLDLQGNLLWGGRKTIDYAGIPPLLYKKSNGNFVGIFNKNNSSQYFTSVIEFDKELAVVKQSSVKLHQNLATIFGQNVGFSDENTTVFAGIARRNSASAASIFFAKADDLFQTGCDTTFTLNIITEPVITQPQSSGLTSHTFSAVNKTVIARTIPAAATQLCGTAVPATLNIGSDSILCSRGPLVLQNSAPGKFDSYLWSTGETTTVIAVTKPGKYWLHATYNCGSQTISDTVTVTEFAFPQPALTADTTACFNQPVQINAGIPGATYRWQDGSADPVFYATRPGNYAVAITVSGCTKKFDVQIGTNETLLMPNIFTPNGDGLNENFAPMEMCGLASGTLKIFNRWGQLLYNTSDLENGWNGRVNGQKSSDGVYYYLLEYSNFQGEQKRKKGWLELVGS